MYLNNMAFSWLAVFLFLQDSEEVREFPIRTDGLKY